MADDEVDLDRERQRTDEAWQGMPLGNTFIPLAVAAAITFHQVQGNARAIVSRQDYDDALGIAAAALSRLVSIYTTLDPREGRVAVPVDLTKQHFVHGATELRSADGSSMRDLSVQRGEMLSAISLIKRAGLPFSFALLSSLTEPARKQKDATRPTPAGC